jgi:hypothetical protein
MRKFVKLAAALELSLVMGTIIDILFTIVGYTEINVNARYQANTMAFLLETLVIDAKSAY